MIQVMIVDDHRILAEGLQKLIEESDIAVVTHIAHTANDCRKLLATSRPDILMLDISLPDDNGVELCKKLKTFYPELKILALTSYGEASTVRQMLENGASGYILKNAMAEEVLEGISTVAKGSTFLCHEVDMLMKKGEENSMWLTSREQELLKLIAEGYTNPEIADKLFLSPETIKGYRKNLLLKFGARNTAMLVKMAIEKKLV